MEVRFSRKVVAMHRDLTSAWTAYFFGTVQVRGTFICLIISLSDHLTVCQSLLCVLVLIRTQSRWLKHVCQWFDKCCLDTTTSWYTKQPLFANHFTGLFCFVLHRMLHAWFLLLNWIHSKIISVINFHINELIKTPGIEFLPLDWIY